MTSSIGIDTSAGNTGAWRWYLLRNICVDITHGAEFMNDLLPLPYTDDTLARICSHIDQVQDTLGQQMLLENPLYS